MPACLSCYLFYRRQMLLSSYSVSRSLALVESCVLPGVHVCLCASILQALVPRVLSSAWHKGPQGLWQHWRRVVRGAPSSSQVFF